MSLKLYIDKATYDTLSDAVKEQYKVGEKNPDEYSLDVDGIEDTGPLKRANERLKLEKEQAEKDKKALQDEKDSDEERKALNRGDIKVLEASWKKKRDDDVAAESAKTEKARKQLQKALVDNVADGLANKISLAPALLAKVIKERLTVDFDADEPSTRVLGTDGKISALSLADLEKELIDTKEYAPIIRASNASGGGAAGNQGGGAAKAFKDMGDAERTALLKSDPARFKRESDAQKAAAH